MVKTIKKIGNSQGIIFDSALLQLARLKVGDHVNIEVHSGGAITLTPLDPNHSMKPVIDEETAASTANRIIKKNDELFRRLS